ncbi:orf104-like protein [Peridroma alphabaculovirus]|uniref:Orf104-like protein n=1 Tax=Peridroma alphabaculovirus TaxID=1346829 RepID=A0A068LK87_9ABAC|nr:orf104-like protein [Peridroma alphabaculovirus]AIE47784.1 orf104-like protein [Peridroma alphabaculovirus]
MSVRTPASLQLLAFRAALAHDIDVDAANSVPDVVRARLWTALIGVQRTADHLRRFLADTRDLDAVLRTLFADGVEQERLYEPNAINRLYELMLRDLTNLDQTETLEFVTLYLHLNAVARSFMPERFVVLWCRDKTNLCKWCTDDCVYVAKEENYYMTSCCSNLKAAYYDHYESQGFTATVTDIHSYCSRCRRPLFNVYDVETYNFPYDMFFCTLCN